MFTNSKTIKRKRKRSEQVINDISSTLVIQYDVSSSHVFLLVYCIKLSPSTIRIAYFPKAFFNETVLFKTTLNLITIIVSFKSFKKLFLDLHLLKTSVVFLPGFFVLRQFNIFYIFYSIERTTEPNLTSFKHKST